MTTLAITGDTTVPAGGWTLNASRARGPGQNGAGPTAGAGGVGWDSGHDLAGAGQTPGQSLDLPNDGWVMVDGALSDGAIGPYGSDVDFTMVGGGGAASGTAGGGSGAKVEGTIPAGATATLVVGGAGADTTLTDDATGHVARARKGTDASGNTPGVGGTTSDNTGWSTATTNGNPGTATTGGDGGKGANYAESAGNTFALAAGAKIRIDTSDPTLTQLLYSEDNFSTVTNLISVGYRGIGAFTDLDAGITTQFVGGNGGFGGATSGGAGGLAASSTLDGDSGADEQVPTGNGPDGVNPGDGGGGAAADGTTGGTGQPGWAEIDYTAAASGTILYRIQLTGVITQA